MKHLKDGALSYLFYLVGTFIFLCSATRFLRNSDRIIEKK